MADVCSDDRYEMIKRVKNRLIERTNIETNPGEMNVIDVILYRFWQLGWLDLIDEGDNDMRYCIDYINPRHPFLDSGNPNVRHYRALKEDTAVSVLTIILSCGCKIIRLYRGNVLQGKLGDWPTPLIVDDDDWVTKEWIDHLKELEELKNY
jgi:hypothetical protein